jgi:hypothetical protein
MFLILHFFVQKKVLKISQTKDTHVATLKTRFGLEGQLFSFAKESKSCRAEQNRH